MTNNASEILRLIETVDPKETAKLDEIDVAFWRLHSGLPIIGISESYGALYYRFPDDWDSSISEYEKCPSCAPYHQVTRSRDALKSIRPEGWAAFSMDFYGAFSDIRFWKCELGKPNKFVASTGLPTEELAELHAIIQAIEHERGAAE